MHRNSDTPASSHRQDAAAPIQATVLAVLAWLVIVAAHLALRPVLPVDETRYLSAAWEMWQRGDFLVPHLNGEPYAHKPPLLFWLIHAGWAVAGVNLLWARLVPSLCGLAAALLLGRMAWRLWPEAPAAAQLAPLLFLGLFFVTFFLPAVMFDMLVVSLALAALLGLWHAAQGRSMTGWLGFGLALGLGLLAKGPVIFVYTLPAAVGGALWLRQRPAEGWGGWYAGVLAGVLIALVPGAAWLVGAAFAGEIDFLREALVDQTADRVSGAIGHGRPIWWFLPLLPAVTLPWLLWPPLWRGLRAARPLAADPGLRMALLAAGAAFVIHSLVGGKQAHYLLPILAIACLPAARLLALAEARPRPRDVRPVAVLLGLAGLLLTIFGIFAWTASGLFNLDRLHGVEENTPLPGLVLLALAAALRWRGVAAHGVRATATVAAVPVVLLLALLLGPLQHARPAYDLAPLSEWLGERQREGRPLAFIGKYHAQFNFLGRLREPVQALRGGEALAAWVRAHPEGLVVARVKRLDDDLPALWDQPYRGGRLRVVEARALLAPPSM